MLHEIFEQFRTGEPVPFVILAILCTGWIIIIERFILLQFVYRINFEKFNPGLRKMLAAGDFDRARTFSVSASKTGLPLIAAKAIDAYQTDTMKVRMVTSEEALRFMPRIRRRVSQIPHLATVAVLLGALSAVHGVWKSFHMAEAVDTGLKSFAFSSQLGDALTPLAFSLVAAVVLMLPYGILDASASRLEGEIEHSLTMILNILAPETQATFVAQPAVMPPGYIDSVGGGGDLDDANAHSAKGINEDAVAERTEQIPDEEEII